MCINMNDFKKSLRLSVFMIQGDLDFEHVLCKPEIHISNFRGVGSEHRSCRNFCNCGCTQVGISSFYKS